MRGRFSGKGFFSGKMMLVIITVTATTGGFILGYFVGRSVSYQYAPAARQSLVDLAPQSAKQEAGAGDSIAQHPAEQVSVPNGVRPDAAPSPGKSFAGSEAPRISSQVSAGDGAAVSGASLEGRTLYTVQSGAFRNPKDAEAMKRKLEAKGHKVSVTKETNAKGVVFYKVRTGEFADKKEASLFALKLKKTAGLNAFATLKK